MDYVIRLHPGDDLKMSIAEFAKEKHIQAGCIVSCAGSLIKEIIRCADGITECPLDEEMEIVSLSGTVSENGCHLHIACSRKDLSVIGGHLCNGCIICSTAELVIRDLENYCFTRELDDETGFSELVIHER